MNEFRDYKYKKPAMEFFCPLCSAPRAFTNRPKLGKYNYLQIAITSTILMLVLHGIMDERVFFIPLVVWISLEFFMRVLFKRQIPCPHCGFDASWYKRDVKVAREKVEHFWQANSPQGDSLQNKEESATNP